VAQRAVAERLRAPARAQLNDLLRELLVAAEDEIAGPILRGGSHHGIATPATATDELSRLVAARVGKFTDEG
jgi:hypothetical protein